MELGPTAPVGPRFIPILKAKGLHVVAVQNPLSSIADDVALTNRLIDAQGGGGLLVGHSYGGAVITEAGMNPKVTGMVYVAAFAPDQGETLGGPAQKFPAMPLFGEFQPIADGFLLFTAKGVMEDFGQDLSPAEKRFRARHKAPFSGRLSSRRAAHQA